MLALLALCNAVGNTIDGMGKIILLSILVLFELCRMCPTCAVLCFIFIPMIMGMFADYLEDDLKHNKRPYKTVKFVCAVIVASVIVMYYLGVFVLISEEIHALVILIKKLICMYDLATYQLMEQTNGRDDFRPRILNTCEFDD